MRVGIVISASGGRAEVSTAKRGLCGNCGKEAACALPVGPTNSASEVVIATNRIGAAPGDTVELDLTGHTELGLSLLVWVVPLVGLILGAVIGYLAATPLGVAQDPAVLAGAIVGLASAYGGLRVVDRRAVSDPRLVPIITRVIDPSACPTLPGEPDGPAGMAGEPADGA